MGGKTAKARFSELDTKRSGLMQRAERYAELTIRSVLPDDSYDTGQDELAGDIPSVGALAVNNLTNKMMLAMFAPSRPFMRYELPQDQKAAMLAALQVTEPQLAEMLSESERNSVRELDAMGARPALYQLITHLIVTGNALRYMDDGKMRILSLRNYVSRRAANGKVIELIIREKVYPADLPDDVKQFTPKQDDTEVTHYRWFKWNGSQYIETQWLDDTLIEHEDYKGKYNPEDMPAYHHVWRLVDGSSYGIGHVEDNIGDLEGISDLSRSEVDGAILASEFRWLVNPGGQTSVEDMNRSVNGQSLPGQDGDVVMINAGAVAGAIQTISNIADKWIRRLSAAFLVTAGMQRDAERVTAEEIRMLATELESSLGGIYSCLAIDLQLPIAQWLMREVKGGVFKGTDFKPVIVTGLDALSRNGDLENIRAFVADVIQFTALPSEVTNTLKIDNIFAALASGRGLKATDYVNTSSEADSKARKAQEDAVNDQITVEAAKQAAKE